MCSLNTFVVSDEWDKLNVSPTFGSGEKGDSGDANAPSSEAAFYKKLENAERAPDRSWMGGGFFGGDSFGLMTDGAEYELKKAAAYFEFDPIEVTSEGYTFRPDVNLNSGMTYDPKVRTMKYNLFLLVFCFLLPILEDIHLYP